MMGLVPLEKETSGSFLSPSLNLSPSFLPSPSLSLSREETARRPLSENQEESPHRGSEWPSMLSLEFPNSIL